MAGASLPRLKPKKDMEKQETPRIRKAYGKTGERTQKMVSFRCDNDILDWLNSHLNKGRYINDLIAADKKRQTGQ